MNNTNKITLGVIIAIIIIGATYMISRPKYRTTAIAKTATTTAETASTTPITDFQFCLNRLVDDKGQATDYMYVTDLASCKPGLTIFHLESIGTYKLEIKK